MKTTISLRALQAVACAASTEETRYYLNGVYLKAAPGAVEYVAIDGHILLATRTANEDTLAGEWIIPSAVCAQFKLAKGRFVAADSDLATLEHLGERNLKLTYSGQSLAFEAIDGTFPDWRSIVPRKCDGKTAQFDVNLLARFPKAAKIMGDSGKLTLAHNGNGPALVRWDGEAANMFGVIMPFCGSTPTLPEWVDAK